MNIENQEDKLKKIRIFVFNISTFSLIVQIICVIQVFIAYGIDNEVYLKIMSSLSLNFCLICITTLIIGRKIREIQLE